mgnify:CR=1 FL=1
MAEFLQQCGSWGVLATLAAYAAGVWVNRKTGKALFNPLLMGSIFMIVFLSCFGVPYADYKSSAQPVSWLLMPATVSLAIPLYEKWELLEKNLAAIFASIAAGVLTSLGSVLAMAWLLKLERAHAVSFLPKSVTTAIGMDVAETLGGTAALAGAVIILTGIVGSLLGETVCKVCHITHPIARGIGIGTDEGTIAIKAKTRGSAKAVKLLIEDMAERGFAGGKVAISHCHNLALAEKLRDGIKELWNTADVGILPTRGLCSYYAERGGLIVSFTEG